MAAIFAPLRHALYRCIATDRGDSLAALRVAKDLARRLNAAVGRPLAQHDELVRRSEARGRLTELRRKGPAASIRRAEPAPVLIYFEAGRNTRALTRIEELLATKGIGWRRLDVGNDEATLDFVTRKAACERDDLPVVFIADHAVGPYEALVAADVSGELVRRVNMG